jgi:hypothetical protein
MVTLTGGKATKNGSYQISPARFLAIIKECTGDKEIMARLQELAKVV